MTLESGKWYTFSEPFRSQLIRVLTERGRPDGAANQPNEHASRAMAKRPPSVKQLALLKKLGCDVAPGTMQEASVLIDKFIGK